MQDLNDMLYFAEVVERGGFAAAGRALGIPKSRLSRRVSDLETQLGVRLLQRTTRKLSLTEVGEAYLRHCQAMRESAEAAADLVAQVQTAPRGTVRVSCPVTLAQTVLGELMPDFLARCPQVRVDMLEANSAEQILGLQQMRLDLALVHSIQPPEGIASQLIVDEPFVVCLPEQHPLCAAAAIDLGALKGDRLILFSTLVSPTYHQRIYEMCLAHGFAPEVRHEVRHWLSVISLVSLGQGVALVPAALERVGLPRLQFRPLLGEHPHSEMLALWRTTPASPLVQALLAHLRQAAQGC